MVEKKVIWTTKLVEEATEKMNDGYILKKIENPFFEGVIGFRRPGLTFNMSEEEVQEYIKCKLDILYFAEKYCYVKGERGQRQKIILRDYQIEALRNFSNNQFNIMTMARQCGKTILSSIYIIHFMIFNNGKNCLTTANKLDTVIEILDKIREIYVRLPFFLQQGIKNMNQKAIVLENKSRIKGFATTKTSSIGQTADMLFLDEFAYVPDNIADKFYKSVFPTIASIENSKIIITSTPNGMNLFYSLLTNAERPEGDPLKNNYKSMRVYWWQVPKRFVTYVRLNKQLLELYGITKEEIYEILENAFPENKKEIYYNEELVKDVINVYNDKNCSSDDVRSISIRDMKITELAEVTSWKEEAIKDIGGEEAFNQEYDLKFVNSSRTLFDEVMIDDMMNKRTEYRHERYDEFNKLKWSYKDLKFTTDENDFIPLNRKKMNVVFSVDISEGLGQDYSIINIFTPKIKTKEEIDRTSSDFKNIVDFFKLKQIGMFRSNVVSVHQLAELLYLLAFEFFNPDNVNIVLELNTYGNELLAHIPHVFDGNNNYGNSVFVRYKHRADATEEKIGLKVNDNKNMLIKDFQDNVKLGNTEMNNYETVFEITTFVKNISKAGNISYSAESANDDTVMTCVNVSTVFRKGFYKSICEELLSKCVDKDLVSYIKQKMKELDFFESTDYGSLISVNRARRIASSYKSSSNGGGGSFGGSSIFGGNRGL